jgi:NAD(P)-dependent dehydrogenase (short-subunit alcohol dehydrogenase family)
MLSIRTDSTPRRYADQRASRHWAWQAGRAGTSVPATGVAVVTGSGSGLGRVIARELLEAGWRVAVAGRRESPLQETVSGTGWSADAALVVPTDVTVPESVAALFAAVDDRWGRLDLLVNNAGAFGPAGAVDELTIEGWRHIVEVNLTGCFLCAHHAVRMMKAQQPRGGRIINNGSISAHSPRPGSVGYTATKHAITGLTKSIALDGRAFDIACGQIDIGNAATEMTAGISRGARQADGSLLAEPTFDARHVATAVRYMAELPLDANVQFLTITATTIPFIGRC